ncbi:TPA: hypothetical protein ACU16Q_000265 [Pasteurella multocida]|uniref:hypothetical protein n=1 Tax=Pasteurella multocida TaxID=747 RepID=UPI00189AC804|nr:hypothetical protein [Pasteurella multocida]MBF6982035.1 hypothetical protein [Pasteurella multocida]
MYGIETAALPLNLEKERLLHAIYDLKIDDLNFINKWYDIEGIPDGTDINKILVFSRANYAKYFDGEKQGSHGHPYYFIVPGVDISVKPSIRFKDGKYQVMLSFVVPINRSNFLGSSSEPWEGEKVKQKKTFSAGIGKEHSYPLIDLRIDLKIVVPIYNINQNDIPEYGIASYDGNGNCIYCNAVTNLVNKTRLVHCGIQSYDGSEKDSDDFYRYAKINGVTLQDDEYLLLSTIAYFDDCENVAPNNYSFSAGSITVGVGPNKTVTSKIEYWVSQSGNIRRGQFPSLASRTTYTNIQVTNPLLLIAKFI